MSRGVPKSSVLRLFGRGTGPMRKPIPPFLPSSQRSPLARARPVIPGRRLTTHNSRLTSILDPERRRDPVRRRRNENRWKNPRNNACISVFAVLLSPSLCVKPRCALCKLNGVRETNGCWRSSTVEQLICNQQVAGSNPFASSSDDRVTNRDAGVAEWLKAADCKSAGLSPTVVRIHPPAPTSLSP